MGFSRCAKVIDAGPGPLADRKRWAYRGDLFGARRAGAELGKSASIITKGVSAGITTPPDAIPM